MQSGDIIQVLTITQSGLCRGVLDSRVGSFRYSHVEMITDKTLRSPKKEKGSRRRNSKRPKPKTVEELLKRIGLEVGSPLTHISRVCVAYCFGNFVKLYCMFFCGNNPFWMASVEKGILWVKSHVFVCAHVALHTSV